MMRRTRMHGRVIAALLVLVCAPPAWAQFTIPDNDEAFNQNQSRWFQTDIDALVAGYHDTYVLDGCAVTAQGTPDMTVAVAAGTVKVAGTYATVSSGNVTISTADATNPRIDLVHADNTGALAATAGTPAANPKAPALPANRVLLAMIYVPANDTDIGPEQITDKRVLRLSWIAESTSQTLTYGDGAADTLVQGAQRSTAGAGRSLTLRAGQANTAGAGGKLWLRGGVPEGGNTGGDVEVRAADGGGSTGTGGGVILRAGAGGSGTGAGGNVEIYGGLAGSGANNGGYVLMRAGDDGDLRLELNPSGNIAGRVLIGRVDEVWWIVRGGLTASNRGQLIANLDGMVVGGKDGVGTDQPGGTLGIAGGLRTGTGNPGHIEFLTSNTTGTSSSTPGILLSRWRITGTLPTSGNLGDLLAVADGGVNIGAAGANRPDKVHVKTDVVVNGASVTLAANTQTLTNKTLDAEGTGNVLSMPFRVWLPAAGCDGSTAGTIWDLPSSTPAVPACVTGTNIQKGVLDYADTSGGFSAQNTFLLPADWTTTGGVDVDLLWTTTATTGNAKWTVQFVCTPVDATATDDPAFPTSGDGFNTVTTAAPGTANRVQTSTITGATLPSSCFTATRRLLHIRLFRDGADAADTISATARFLGASLTYRRAM